MNDKNFPFDLQNEAADSLEMSRLVNETLAGVANSDEALAAEVREALLRDTLADAHNVEVKAEDGEVFLWGMVPDRHTKRAIEDCAASLRGVRHVHTTIVSERD